MNLECDGIPASVDYTSFRIRGLKGNLLRSEWTPQSNIESITQDGDEIVVVGSSAWLPAPFKINCELGYADDLNFECYINFAETPQPQPFTFDPQLPCALTEGTLRVTKTDGTAWTYNDVTKLDIWIDGQKCTRQIGSSISWGIGTAYDLCSCSFGGDQMVLPIVLNTNPSFTAVTAVAIEE